MVVVPEYNPRYNVSAAQQYGGIYYLIEDQISPFDTELMVAALHEGFDNLDFNPSEDYVCMTGNSLVLSFCLAVATARWPRNDLKILEFDARNSQYRERIFNASARNRISRAATSPSSDGDR